MTRGAVFFDLDGTLTDPAEGITAGMAYALEKLGRPVPSRKELERFIGPHLRKTFPVMLGETTPALIEQAIDLYRDYYVGQKGMYACTVYPGVAEMLVQLAQAGHPLLTATAKPTSFAEQILEHFGLATPFTRIYGSEMDGTRADKGDLIAYIIERENLNPAIAWMVGDRGDDMRGAKACGVQALGVLWGYGAEDELRFAGADDLVAHPKDVAKRVMG